MFEAYLKNGAKRKFIVIKIDDMVKHVNSVFKLAMIDNDLKDIQAGRKSEGKEPCPEYLVINTDEPYANEIIEILKRNGHWGVDGEYKAQTETCQACENEFIPETNGGYVNAHPFCLKCLIHMVEETAKKDARLTESYCDKAEKQGDKCLGYSRNENDDEPIPFCKDCTKCTSYEDPDQCSECGSYPCMCAND
jgi:hypothetical protein